MTSYDVASSIHQSSPCLPLRVARVGRRRGGTRTIAKIVLYSVEHSTTQRCGGTRTSEDTYISVLVK